MKQSYALKTFLFQKNILCKLDDSIPARNFKKNLCFTFRIPQFIYDDPDENFLVYLLISHR